MTDAARQLSVNGIRLRQRVGGIQAQECPELRIHALDLVQARPHGFPCRDFAAGEAFRQPADAESVQRHASFRRRVSS
jgi:hypothetical protein